MRSLIHVRLPAFGLRTRSALCTAVALAALAACADETRLPTASRTTDGAAAARGPLRDRDIDRSDSHFAVRVVTTTEESTTGGDFSIASKDPDLAPSEDAVHVEAGYSSTGEIRFGVWFDDRTLHPTVGRIQAVGDVVSVFDHRGVLQEGLVFDYFMAQFGLPGGSLIGAYFPSEPPGSDPCVFDPSLCGPSAQGGVSGARVTTEDLGDIRIVRTELEPAGVGAASVTDQVSLSQRYRRVSVGSGAAHDAAAGSGEAGPPSATRDVWRLEEVVREHRHGPAGQERITRTRQQMEYARWHRNALKDAARDVIARSARTQTAGALASPPAPLAESAPVSLLARPADDAPLTPVASAALLGSVLCPRGTSEFDDWAPKGTSGSWLLFQHGFCSTADTWSGMRTVLPPQVNAARARAYSLTSTARIDQQVDELVGRLEHRPVQRNVVIGHSAGGIVGRRLGQRYPDQVEGVVTLGTPNLGSITASIGGTVVGDILKNVASAPCYASALCQILTEVLAEETAGQILGGLISATAPAVDDLRVGSPFLNTLNNAPETFPRVSVAVTIPSRWAVVRMFGDGRSPRWRLTKGQRPAGDARVTEAQRLYQGAIYARLISAFMIWQVSPYGGAQCDRFGYSLSWPACTTPSSLGYWYEPWFQTVLLYLVYDIAGRVITLMDRIDAAWHYVTKGANAYSDGFIHTPSQGYPSAPGTFPPLRLNVIGQYADSHSGQTASPEVVNVLREAVSHVSLARIQ